MPDQNLSHTLTLKRDDEPLLIQSDPQPVPIACDNFARTAVSMYEGCLYFIHRQGLQFDFCRDLNGSGTQRLRIVRPSVSASPDWQVELIFSPVYSGDCIYEADLLMDGRKDYDPTINKGKHGFQADSIRVETVRPDTIADWLLDVYRTWQTDLDYLSLPHETLDDWVQNGFHMWAMCQTPLCHRSVLSHDDLRRYADAGLSLDELRARMRCSRCGMRGARVKPC